MPKRGSKGTPSKPARRSTRIKRDELQSEQFTEAAVQEVFSEKEEIRPLPKKRTKTTSLSSKNTRAKRVRNEEKHQTTEERKTRVDSDESNSHETEAKKDALFSNKNKPDDFTILPVSQEKYNVMKDASSQDTLIESSRDNSNFHEIDPLIESKWELVKANLFEVPREPLPPYREYIDKLFIRRPWMKKKDIDYLQKLYTDPDSLLAKKQLKHLINYDIYKDFTIENKSRLLNLLPKCDLVPIASDDVEPIDSPRIQREHKNAGLEAYEAGVSGQVSELDPNKVCPRFDFWSSDSFKDARWWFQTSIKLGYNTKYGIDIQWNNLEKFKTVIPDYWKCDEYEREWGIGLWAKIGEKQIAGDSAQMSLPEMAKAQVIRLNDSWKYKRQFKNVGVTVSMDLKVIAINQSNGHMDFKLIKDGEEIIINDINKPTRLENEVLDFDGRVAKGSRPNGNAFKNFRIVRSEGYTPSLFEARKEYWAKIQ
ncbi:10133_t:CDS:2 [Funneliformis geosporum]|uniref:1649_t:CDS:1 n=1 Tax=Funneliformis geosporum TaxID=1117311 RepID=A0A9W4SVP3_9GLOM|nr:1649_t:CDS:2 [Funneliformis geosporum]CAI2186062.1 10133_t:CDS:2 [Funneliformis geosporum]